MEAAAKWRNCKNNDLKECLEERNLPVSGTKEEKVQRLLDFDFACGGDPRVKGLMKPKELDYYLFAENRLTIPTKPARKYFKIQRNDVHDLLIDYKNFVEEFSWRETLEASLNRHGSARRIRKMARKRNPELKFTTLKQVHFN